MGSTEKAAQQTLDAFLNEYCSTRAGQIGQPVKTTTVTWWPFGAGVIVELNEGGPTDRVRPNTPQGGVGPG